ncbi:MAG: hypothetical protein DMG05_12355 [Acidobacteria bacterium]|nr:MAG: hypothetical protein DMG05_12355 [Acidobacteriota bacterium]
MPWFPELPSSLPWLEREPDQNAFLMRLNDLLCQALLGKKLRWKIRVLPLASAVKEIAFAERSAKMIF